jgi:hypothetical protein
MGRQVGRKDNKNLIITVRSIIDIIINQPCASSCHQGEKRKCSYDLLILALYITE